MNRFLGLSGLVHLAIFGGIIYFCATYDYSSPYKLDRADLEVKAESAPVLARAESAPAVKEIVTPKTEVKTDVNPVSKLEKSAKEDLKAIEKFEKKLAAKKELPKTLPKAKVSRQEIDKAADEGIAQAQQEINIPVVAPVEDKKEENDQQAQKDQFEQDRAELAKKSQEEKQAILARLKDLNTANDEKARAKEAQATAGAATEVVTHARPEEGQAVKGIEEFKQQAGNPVPAFDQDDRLKARAGTVVFQAYVTKEGQPQEFEMIESSGHRSLDYKTLKALKQWKFEPGQEGWVEIPFRWDLKGGPQELPSTLRKKLSSH